METREVPGWPGYLAREDGVVLGKNGKPLSPSAHRRTGHLRVRLYGKAGHLVGTRSGRFANLYVHQVICMSFHGEPPFEGALVRHLDNNCQNNRPENLVWGDYFENARDYWSDAEAVYQREERKGIRGRHAPYTPDLFCGF